MKCVSLKTEVTALTVVHVKHLYSLCWRLFTRAVALCEEAMLKSPLLKLQSTIKLELWRVFDTVLVVKHSCIYICHASLTFLYQDLCTYMSFYT